MPGFFFPDKVRRLSQYLKCGDSLEEMLRGRLVCGENAAAGERSNDCFADPTESVRYHPAARICNSTSSSYTKRESERE